MVLGIRTFGRCLGHDGEALMNEISALIKGILQKLPGPLPLFLSEDRVKRQRFINQPVGLHQVPNLSPPGSCTSQSLELWEINLWEINTQTMVFCYSSLNGPRHWQCQAHPSSVLIKAAVFLLLFFHCEWEQCLAKASNDPKLSSCTENCLIAHLKYSVYK